MQVIEKYKLGKLGIRNGRAPMLVLETIIRDRETSRLVQMIQDTLRQQGLVFDLQEEIEGSDDES